MTYLKFTFGIFIILAASRFIPHPPNFTSLIALSFYIPLILGNRFIPAILLSLAFTDIIIGMHNTILYTWGSIIVIGLISHVFKQNIFKRILGTVCCASLFFIITNFGVWTIGNYGYNFNGLVSCYVLAIPFFGQTLISTLVYSGIIEVVIRIIKINKLNKKYL